jgi:hypothetical protein
MKSTNAKGPRAKEIIAAAEEICEGLDQRVAEAPDLNVEEIMEWICRADQLPEAQKELESYDVIFAFVKGLRAGRFKLEDIVVM